MEIPSISAVAGGARLRWPQPVQRVQPVAAVRPGGPEASAVEVGPRPVMVPYLASEISAERARGELQPWQEISGQYLLVLASRFTAGDPTPVPDRLLEASLRYLADGGSRA